ncbi:MAG: hypothetical protein HPY70_10845 [Firmicutes bacterium]|nr:hypothetical protein [Bacillota bacterium]
MASIKGIVIDVKDRYVYLATRDGQFVKRIYNGPPPLIGTEIEIKEDIKVIPWKIMATAAAVLVMAFSSLIYLYKIPTAYMAIDINPGIQLGVSPIKNIVKAEALNEDGQILLNHTHLIGLKVEKGLEEIIVKAIDTGYINETKTNVIQITVVKTGLATIDPREVEKPVVKELEERNLDGYVKVRKAEKTDLAEAEKQNIQLNAYMIKKELDEEIKQKIKDKPEFWKKPVKEILKELDPDEIFEENDYHGKKHRKEDLLPEKSVPYDREKEEKENNKKANKNPSAPEKRNDTNEDKKGIPPEKPGPNDKGNDNEIKGPKKDGENSSKNNTNNKEDNDDRGNEDHDDTSDNKNIQDVDRELEEKKKEIEDKVNKRRGEIIQQIDEIKNRIDNLRKNPKGPKANEKN